MTTPETFRQPLVIEEIEIRRAPGISPGFALHDLSPDITIVFGPNASGKSTTARAIQAVLWPHESSLRGHHLAASFSLDGQRWQIEASASGVRRTRDGEEADPPTIAPLDDRGRYVLALPELLASENQPLAQAILNESSGGFDLPQVASGLGFASTIPPRLESANRVNAATESLQQVTAREDAIAASIATRGALLVQREQSLTAERELAAIDTALEYRRKLAEESELATELAQFPETVRRFTGDEPAQIAKLNDDIARQSTQLTETLRQRDRWQQQIEATGLAAAANPADQLKSLRSAQSQLAEIETLLISSARDVVAAETERSAHQQRLATDLDDEQIAAVDADGMREFADIAASYESIRARRTARDEIELWLGGVKAPENLDVLRQGVETLQTRLQYPNAAEQRDLTGKPRFIGIGGGVLLAIAGAVLALEINPLWWIAAVIGVMIAFLAWRTTQSASPRIAAQLERDFAALPLPQPEIWRAHHVRDLLQQLRDELKIATVEQEKADRWNDLEHERAELDAAYTQTESRRERAIEKYGIAPDLKEESLRLLAENLARWQAADAAVRGLESRRNRLTTDKQTLQNRATDQLRQLGLGDGEIGPQLDELDRRIERYQHASQERDALQQQVDDALQPRLDTLVAEKDAIYRAFDLEPNDAAGLQHILGQRARLIDTQDRLQQRQETARAVRESLSLTPELRDQDVPTLTAARDAAQRIAGQYAEVESQLAEIDRTERAAMHATDRETALAALESTRVVLARDRDRVMASTIGAALLQTVQEETRDAALPIVFHRARELFAIITRGKYELQFEAGPPPEFTALDTATGLTLALDQLSSGTRVQLLMAIRLAFVENVEVGPKLPVILDETLGNSDELRASAIIDAAIDICQHGRQVFYFTAQGEEVARWLHRVDAIPAESRPEIKVIELAEIRRDAGFDRLSIPDIATITRAPRTASLANAQATAIDPWAESVGGIDLAHLVADAEVLAALKRKDITTYGQLDSLERSNPEQLQSTHPRLAEQLPQIHARANAVQEAITLWRIGRSRSLPTGALAESELIYPAALPELEHLQAEVGYDGADLIATLRAMDNAALADHEIDALEQQLIAQGYISQQTPLALPDIRERLTASAGDASDIEDLLAQVESW